MPTYRTPTGAAVILSDLLGSGGEGDVYKTAENPRILAKIYKNGAAALRREKVTEMVKAGWHSRSPNIAFPIDVLLDKTGTFAGFTMNFVGNQKQFHEVYGPTSRKANFPQANFRFLVRVALNISRSLSSIHSAGCIVGDLNEAGILVSHQATVSFIDCDSFQFEAAGKLYRCLVAKPEFTAPELQGQKLNQVVRTKNHDAFGLAVCIFYLLFMGKSPFGGKYLGPEDLSISQMIEQFRFAYSHRKSETRTEPPPNSPLLDCLPPEIAAAFETAFGPQGPAKRPSAANWVAMLERAEQAIVQCRSNSAHQYFRDARHCPWCAMEQAIPGFVTFVPKPVLNRPVLPNLNLLFEEIRNVRDPGPAPSLHQAVTVRKIPLKRLHSWSKFIAINLASALVGFELIFLKSDAVFMGAAVLIFCFFYHIKTRDLDDALKARLNAAEASFADLELQWGQHADNVAFTEQQREADVNIAKFTNLPADEARELAALKTNLREGQLNRFLQRYYIAHTQIPTIGDTRKLALLSYGIETAADIDRQHIEQHVPGFGPAITQYLMDWKKQLEATFMFDPSLPVNPADISEIRLRFARTQQELRKSIQQSLITLRATSEQVIKSREAIRQSATLTWTTICEIEAHAKSLKSFFRTAVAIAVFGISWFAISELNSTRPLSRSLPKMPAWTAPSAPPVRTYYSRGLSDRANGNQDLAIEDFTRAINQDHQRVAAYNGRGDAYRQKGLLDLAVMDHSEAIRLDPANAAAYTSRAADFFRKNNFDAALADYDSAIRIDPTDSMTYYNRGSIFRLKGNPARAMSDYTQAISLDPKNAQAFFARSLVHKSTGNLDAATSDYNQGLKIDPSLSAK